MSLFESIPKDCLPGLTLFRKIDYRPWKRLRDELERHYLNSHDIKSPSARRMFLTRCRNYKEIRDIGLQYVVFCPKLTVWAETLNVKDWQLRKPRFWQARRCLRSLKPSIVTARIGSRY